MPTRLLAQWEGLTTRWPVLAKLVGGSSLSVGLDLGSTSVKAVALTQTATGLALAGSSVLPLPPNADRAQRLQVIRQLFQAVNGSQGRVVAAVGGPGAMLRWVTLPKMTPQELSASLAFEAEKHIPLKLDEVFLDSAILGDRPGGQMEVLLAAARKELVAAQVELLEAAEIPLAVMDLESVALANAWALSAPPAGQIVGLLHVGARATIVDIVSGPQLQFSREVPLGGHAFTQAIAEGLQLDASHAEALQCDPGARAAEVRTALQSCWAEWWSQCRASCDFYENQFGHAVERLVMTGGAAHVAGFREWAQETSGLPTEIGNPLAGLASTGAAPAGPEAALAIAVGLAVRGRDR